MTYIYTNTDSSTNLSDVNIFKSLSMPLVLPYQMGKEKKCNLCPTEKAWMYNKEYTFLYKCLKITLAR